jgi:hypothetical protein
MSHLIMLSYHLWLSIHLYAVHVSGPPRALIVSIQQDHSNKHAHELPPNMMRFG